MDTEDVALESKASVEEGICASVDDGSYLFPANDSLRSVDTFSLQEQDKKEQILYSSTDSSSNPSQVFQRVMALKRRKKARKKAEAAAVARELEDQSISTDDASDMWLGGRDGIDLKLSEDERSLLAGIDAYEDTSITSMQLKEKILTSGFTVDTTISHDEKRKSYEREEEDYASPTLARMLPDTPKSSGRQKQPPTDSYVEGDQTALQDTSLKQMNEKSKLSEEETVSYNGNHILLARRLSVPPRTISERVDESDSQSVEDEKPANMKPFSKDATRMSDVRQAVQRREQSEFGPIAGRQPRRHSMPCYITVPTRVNANDDSSNSLKADASHPGANPIRSSRRHSMPPFVRIDSSFKSEEVSNSFMLEEVSKNPPKIALSVEKVTNREEMQEGEKEHEINQPAPYNDFAPGGLKASGWNNVDDALQTPVEEEGMERPPMDLSKKMMDLSETMIDSCSFGSFDDFGATSQITEDDPPSYHDLQKYRRGRPDVAQSSSLDVTYHRGQTGQVDPSPADEDYSRFVKSAQNYIDDKDFIRDARNACIERGMKSARILLSDEAGRDREEGGAAWRARAPRPTSILLHSRYSTDDDATTGGSTVSSLGFSVDRNRAVRRGSIVQFTAPTIHHIVQDPDEFPPRRRRRRRPRQIYRRNSVPPDHLLPRLDLPSMPSSGSAGRSASSTLSTLSQSTAPDQRRRNQLDLARRGRIGAARGAIGIPWEESGDGSVNSAKDRWDPSLDEAIRPSRVLPGGRGGLLEGWDHDQRRKRQMGGDDDGSSASSISEPRRAMWRRSSIN